MKLATLKEGGRDGTLVVVSWDLARCVPVPGIAPTLQAALDRWAETEPRLREVFHALDQGRAEGVRAFDPAACHSPLPRAYQFADGSAYVVHVELVRKARGAEMPQTFWTDPLMYQGGSDAFVGPRDPIRVIDDAWGIDFESEVAVVTDDVPMGVTPEAAAGHVKLVMLCNDVSLRNLIPGELAKGFGFFQSKPASSFSPVAVTPDSIGEGWDGRRLNLPLVTHLNGQPFGRPNAGVDMVFDFGQLVAHAAKTRNLCAGTIVGSGTVANRDRSVGSSCLAEKRTLETIEQGRPVTPFMAFGDRVRIQMLDAHGNDVFGAIDQVVEKAEPGRFA
jgi:fumarylacetoacetate (FAA) hydrolase